MNYALDRDFVVEFGFGRFYEVYLRTIYLRRVYMNLGVSWVIFYHFRFEGLGFGVTSGLGFWVLAR